MQHGGKKSDVFTLFRYFHVLRFTNNLLLFQNVNVTITSLKVVTLFYIRINPKVLQVIKLYLN